MLFQGSGDALGLCGVDIWPGISSERRLQASNL